MASKAPKKKESKERVASAVPKTAPEQSVAPSVIGSQNERDDRKKNKQPIIIWPEWSDQDIAAEKWDTAHKAKEKDKVRSPNPHPFEDSEGRIDMPSALKSRVDHWKRPVDFILEKTPVVVDPKSLMEDIDLLSANEHLADSETVRLIISQITNLWKLHIKVEPVGEIKKDVKEGKADKDKDKDKEKEKDKDGQAEDNYWKPWAHIWPKEKSKGCVYNPGGKYCIRVYWMGAWRKVTIDDWMPFDEEGKLLLPCGPNEHELWPMLLSKALIKVASLDYAGGSSSCEFGDFTVVHALTGWMPEIIPLRYGHTSEVWKLLLQALPHWKLENAAPSPDESKRPTPERNSKAEREKERKSTRGEKSHGKDGQDRSDTKGKDKDKDTKGTVPGTAEAAPKEPEFVIFASYSHPPNTPMRISVLREMADASEKLRQSGLSHNHPHPVMVTMIRDCPLVAPPPPVQIPRWKLIRQKKKKDPVEPPLAPPEPPKDPQFLEVTSPFVNYNVSPIPVSRARTPVRWLKFKPERPMGEIAEEGDKGEGEQTKDETGRVETTNGSTEKKETADDSLNKEDDKTNLSKEGEESRGELDVERQSKESLLRERCDTKGSVKSASKEPIRSAKSDRQQDKSQVKADKMEKSKSGGKLVPEKPERTKSGSAPKSGGRRMSRMEKDVRSPPDKESRKMSRMEKTKITVDLLERESSRVDSIQETIDIQSLEVPIDGEKSVTEETEGESGEEKQDVEKVEMGDKAKEERLKEKKLWMEFEDFCKCFGSLYIFHKPNTYNCTKSNTELKDAIPQSPPTPDLDQRWAQPASVGSGSHDLSKRRESHEEKSLTRAARWAQPASVGSGSHDLSKRRESHEEKSLTRAARWAQPASVGSGSHDLSKRRESHEEKSLTRAANVATTTHTSKKPGLVPASSVTGATPVPGKNTAFSPSPYGHLSSGPYVQEPPPPYLFVDSLKPIEIVVSFTAFSKWLDPPQPIVKEKDKEREKDSASSVTELKLETAVEDKPPSPSPGLLVAEPYSWKSVVTGQPVLRIRTTGTKAAVLCLPAGRHVLRFLLQSPHGYHIEMCSQTQFVYGDEDTVMGCLTKESCRFMEHAMTVMQNIGNVVHSFTEPPTNKRSELDLGLKDQSRPTQERHYKVFMKCLFKTLKFHLGEMFDSNMHFAWKAFTFQASLGIRQHISHRPYSAAEITKIGSVKRQVSPLKRRTSVPPTWIDRTPNGDEEKAAEKIQAVFRGHFQRKLAKAFKPNTEEHQQVSELLSKAWGTIEQNMEDSAIEIFRRMFKKDQALFSLFPFYKDEWSRVAFVDYTGGYTEQPPHSWFVVFREVFFVDEPVLTVPKLYVNISTCLLRVVDNDSGEELTRVFQRVAPNTLKKNKRGYTFVAEARTLNGILPPGKFRLRIIGSTEPLPYPARDSVNSHFVTKEIRDYYIPNKYNVIFRYTVKVTDDHVVSLQLGTSKSDVYIKLQILDQEQEVASTAGKGHAVIPAFTFFRDRTGDEDEKHSGKGSRPPTSTRPRSGKRPQSGRKPVSPAPDRKSKKSGKQSTNSSRPGSSSKSSRTHLGPDSEEEEEVENDTEPEVKIHKYIIQAQVLHDSWPLSRSSWDFINMLKSLDKLDISECVPTGLPGRDKLSASTTKGKKGKDSKEKEGKESRSSKGQSGSRPSSQQQFDSSKPNWTLRVISDANAEEVEIKKDTERQDEIKAMKLAWEAAEPGRAAKAQQSRQKFLNEHMIKLEREATEEETGEEELQHGDGEAPSEIFTVTSPVQSEAEGELTLVPPPKEPDQVLRPLPPPPCIRSRGGDPVLLDAEEEGRRQKKRQEVFRAFREQREEVERLREQDRTERNAAKERQLQVAEELQAALDKARHDVNVPRETYRQRFLEAEKQKEEAQAAEAAKEKDRSPSPRGSKSRKSASTAKGGRKSPAKGKKK